MSKKIFQILCILVGIVCGPTAWIMGASDLRTIANEKMDTLRGEIAARPMSCWLWRSTIAIAFWATG